MQKGTIGKAEQSTSLPAQVLQKLGGEQLEAYAADAICLSTVGEEGWPHTAQLSVGEVLAISETELLVAIWPASHTSKSLRRDGRLTLCLAADGALINIRATATLAEEHQTSLDLAVFRIHVDAVKEDRAAYADVISGITFRLHDREETFARWREQIKTLKQLAELAPNADQ